MWRNLLLLGLSLILTTGCGSATPGATSSSADASAAPATTGSKHITLAFPRELDLAHSGQQGRQLLRPLVNPGLSTMDDTLVRRPALAETVPTLENGLWTVAPDGSMDMTWTIRAGARWHDGVPFTTDDLLFTAEVGHDREVPILSAPIWREVEDVVASD